MVQQQLRRQLMELPNTTNKRFPCEISRDEWSMVQTVQIHILSVQCSEGEVREFEKDTIPEGSTAEQTEQSG